VASTSTSIEPLCGLDSDLDSSLDEVRLCLWFLDNFFLMSLDFFFFFFFFIFFLIFFDFFFFFFFFHLNKKLWFDEKKKRKKNYMQRYRTLKRTPKMAGKLRKTQHAFDKGRFLKKWLSIAMEKNETETKDPMATIPKRFCFAYKIIIYQSINIIINE